MTTEMQIPDRTLSKDSVIDLDQPCNFCKVLDLDDSQHGGVAKTVEDGAPFVDFGQFVETVQERISTEGTTLMKAKKALSYVMRNHDLGAPRTATKTELGLDYSRSDKLPELPGLGATETAGCAFCKVLRNDLIEAWRWIEQNWDNEYEVQVDLEDEQEEAEAKAEAKTEAEAVEEGDDEDNGEEEEEVKSEGEDNDQDDKDEREKEKEKEEEKEEGENKATDTESPNKEGVDQKTDEPELSDIFEDSDGSSVFTNADAEEGTGIHKIQGDNKQEEDQEKATKPVTVTDKRPSKAELIISEIVYKLREYPPDGERPQRTWSDALFVFFTIGFKGKTRKYSMSYNFYAETTDPCASWLQINRRPYTSNPLSPTSLKRMHELIRQSEEKQPVKIVEKPFLPTRLLDVQASCPSGLRLVITETDPDVCKLEASQRRYAALSYCWGSGNAAAKQLKTTKDTLEEHCTSINMEKVPQTVADSIQVCRAIGIRFLWVDALCIIQGDAEDWSKESFQMSLIYENSYLTLCVVQGDSCSSGFLEKDYSPPSVRLRFQSRVDPSISGNITLRMLHPPSQILRRETRATGKYGSAGKSPGQLDLECAWCTRGWTFQEDQLAPRKIFFGSLIFHVSRGGDLEAADGSSVGHRRFVDTMDSSSRELSTWYGMVSLQRGLGTWYSMVSGYSHRNLSFQQDKFPAIAALARSFSERFGGQKYLAGLWESDIHKGLLWTHPEMKEFDDYQKLRPKDYVAPSWSWASRPSVATWILGEDEPANSELIIRSTDVVPEKHNPFGRVSKGRLLLTARMYKPLTRRNGKVRIKHTSHPWKHMGATSMNYALCSKKNKCIARMIFDWDSLCARNDKGYPRGPMNDILLVLTASIFPEGLNKSRDLPDNQEMMLGIVVRPSLEQEGAYENLGLFYSEQREKGGWKFWDEVPMQDIVLV